MDFMWLKGCSWQVVNARISGEENEQNDDVLAESDLLADQAKGTLLQNPTRVRPNLHDFNTVALATAELQHHNPNGYYKDHYLPRELRMPGPGVQQTLSLVTGSNNKSKIIQNQQIEN